MRFASRLYVGGGVRDSAKTRWRLKHNAGQLNLYVIALSGGSNQLEIFHCAFLQQKFYKSCPPDIVGFAQGYGEALELVKKMVEDVYRITGECEIKNYFRQFF